MATARKTPLQRAKQATSWLALVAATSLGLAATTTLAEIRSDAFVAGRTLRLVVQTFSDDSTRPASATQRQITQEELKRGVRVDVVALTEGVTQRVVAWVEEGEAVLEFDGRTAHPQPGSLRGEAQADTAGRAAIVLSLPVLACVAGADRADHLPRGARALLDVVVS